MTLFLADIALWQADITLAELGAAGFRGINVKVSHGLTQTSVHPRVQTYVTDARNDGWALSSFHWLDNSADGAEQAGYAYERLRALGLHKDAAHVVDCEDDADYDTYTRYCDTMATLLKRPVVTYTGDWWWERRAWKPSPVSPWLHSAPIPGYLPAYPGDDSAHWAGYGGWPELGIMQYRVAPVAGVRVSQSAVRSMDIWRAMTGSAMTTSPASILAVRREFQKRTDLPPASLGIARNKSDTSYHVGKTFLKAGAYSYDESPRDRAGLSEASSAIDIGDYSFTHNGKTHNLRSFSRWLVAECEKGAPDTKDIREIIYTLDGATVKRWDRLKKRTSGDPSHRWHTHVSWFRDSEFHDRAAAVRRYFAEEVEGDDMTPVEMTAWAKSADGRAALAAAVAALPVRNTGRDLNTVLSDLFSGEQRANSMIAPTAATYRQKQLRGIEGDVAALSGKVAALAAAVDGLQLVDTAELARLVLAGLPAGTLTLDDVETAVRNVLRTGVEQ
jgi:hypothetical protein